MSQNKLPRAQQFHSFLQAAFGRRHDDSPAEPKPAGGATGEPGDQAQSEIIDQTVRITCTDYSPDEAQTQDVADLADFLQHHRPPWCRVRWIDVVGLGRADVVRALAEKYQLHPLAVEDVLHLVQRPKAEDYPGSGDLPGRLFVVARAVDPADGQMRTEQVSFFLGRTTLLTFQEAPGDIFESVRRRIATSGSRIREHDASFLLYSLIDTVTDDYFPVLEKYSDELEDLEEEVLAHPDQGTSRKVHALKRKLLLLRRAAWPMRELISQLLREKHECLSETTRTYFRDVYDHCVQIIDLIETYREIASGVMETYMSAVSNRMNEIMKVLTIISTIFMPLSFVAGVYGMNLQIPEAEYPEMYGVFWLICLGVGGGLLYWFRRRNWI